MRKLSLLCLLLLIVAGLSGCKDEQQAAGQAPAPLVGVVDVKAADVAWNADFLANAAGSRSVEVRARVQGVIEKRLYREGDFIKAGQLMFQLERDQYEAIYEQARAAYHNAEREWKRVKPLYAANAVSQKERDQALSDYESTKAAMRQAKINLDYCQVVAPVTGYTSKESQTEGNLVSNTTLLTSINQTEPMYIEFSMSAQDWMYRQQLARENRLVTPADGIYAASLTLMDGRTYDKPGTIEFIDSQVVASMGIIRARAIFPNEDNVIMPGQYVRVTMSGDVLVNAVLVPQTCVSITDSGSFVMVVDSQNIVHRTKVDLGPFVGKDYLVNSGLVGGERLVSDGLLKARDGSPVRYEDPNALKAAPAEAGAGEQQAQ